MRKMIRPLNNSGSAIIQSMIVAIMVVTLSGSLSTLNIGRAKSLIQLQKKAAALTISQVVKMHLSDLIMCQNTIVSSSLPNFTVANHNNPGGTDGIELDMVINYPYWAGPSGPSGQANNNPTTLTPARPAIPGNFATLPASPPESVLFGGTTLYIDEVLFVLPITAGEFDRDAIGTYTLPDGAGGLRNIVSYTGSLVVTIRDSSDLPVPIAPIIQRNFTINIDETNTATPVFESCTADTGLEETCIQNGGQWLVQDSNGVPYDPPFCHVGLADDAGCGADEYIKDFDNAGFPICERFLVDCEAGGRDNYFLSGFDSAGNIRCSAGTGVVINYIDCPPHNVRWIVGSDQCNAFSGVEPADPTVGLFQGNTVTLTDSAATTTGSATFQCILGQYVLQGGATCTSPSPVYNWDVGAWSGCSGVTPPACGSGYSWKYDGWVTFSNCAASSGASYGSSPATSTAWADVAGVNDGDCCLSTQNGQRRGDSNCVTSAFDRHQMYECSVDTGPTCDLTAATGATPTSINLYPSTPSYRLSTGQLGWNPGDTTASFTGGFSGTSYSIAVAGPYSGHSCCAYMYTQSNSATPPIADRGSTTICDGGTLLLDTCSSVSSNANCDPSPYNMVSFCSTAAAEGNPPICLSADAGHRCQPNGAVCDHQTVGACPAGQTEFLRCQ